MTSTTDRVDALRKQIDDLTAMRTAIHAELHDCPARRDTAWYDDRIGASMQLYGSIRAAQDHLAILTVADDSDSVMV